MNIKRIMLFLCYASYFMFGMVLGMRTNIFLFIQRDYLDGYKHIANLVLISGIGMQLTLYLAGYLIERFGFQKVLSLGLIISVLPLSMMLFVDSALAFDIFYILFMFGYGIVVLNLNLFVSHLVPERKGNALLTLHLYFALGALIGPKLISQLTDEGISWQKVISMTVIPVYLILIILVWFNYRKVNAQESPKLSTTTSSGKDSVMAYLKEPFVWLFILAFVCSQVWEYGLGTWFVIFANNTKGYSSSEAAFYLTLFYASYPLVRILFSRIIHHLNLVIVIAGAFICCIIFGSLGMFTGLLYFYSLTGMGIALMYPGIMAAMQQIFGEGSTKKIGFITMTGGLLQYCVIWSVGLMSDYFGIGVGFNFMIVYLFIGLFSILGILMIKSGENIKGAVELPES
jgi:fucose permease